ncbi:transcription factor bHLH61-like [Apium graveolens]|uniref:transcription factor bHLH61-like n=1 Tax=Apium graveolens TaxID=4045 RepID=UPI003D79A422
MVSREHKKAAAAALHEKLQLLRSITNSHALNETSIIVDASKYIADLKQKVDRLNQDIGTGQSSSHNQTSWPVVAVETLEKGFLVNIHSDRTCPGLLVPILGAFEELGLIVSEARVSCIDSFRLEALGGEDEEIGESINAQVVEQAVSQAIRNWREINDQD